MMVSPKAVKAAGDKFVAEAGLRRAVQVRRARRAGSHHARAIRRLLGQGPHPHRSRHLCVDAGRDGALRQSALRPARPDRAGARDRHSGRARPIRSSSSCCRRQPSPTRASPSISPTPIRPRTRSGRTPRCARRSTSRSIARRSTRWCSTASTRRAINSPARAIPTTSRNSRFRRATSRRRRR